MRGRHPDIDRQILEQLVTALLLRLTIVAHVMRRVLLVVRLVILFGQHQILVLVMVMHELLLQRIFAVPTSTRTVSFILDPLAVLSVAFVAKGGWKAAGVRLLVNADVMLLAHAAQVELLRLVLHHRQIVLLRNAALAAQWSLKYLAAID